MVEVLMCWSVPDLLCFALTAALWSSKFHLQTWKIVHTKHIWKLSLILETCASYECAASISFQLPMNFTVVDFCWRAEVTTVSSIAFNCWGMLAARTSITSSAIQHLFDSVSFSMSPQIAWITLFFKILWLSTLAVPLAFTQGPYQAQTIHKKINSWGGQFW